MSIRSKVLAAAAVVTVLGGVSAAGALSATAATPSCGPSCIDIFSKNFGTHHNPQFVLDVYQQAEKVGQPVILFRQSNSDPAEDFTISEEGEVSDFYQAGLVSSALNLHYGCGFNIQTGKCSTTLNPVTGKPWPDDFAFEVQYAPYGVDSGLCVGVGSPAASGVKVALEPCGVSSATVLIADTVDSCPVNPLYSAEVPAIIGNDANFSEPFVLNYPAAGYPTDSPRPELFLANLNGFSQVGGPGICGTGSVTGPNSNQLWSAVEGVLP